MGLASLDAALSGLRVSQQQLSVISNNIANVSTEGYSRKILPQSTLAVNGESVAVRADTIIRRVDTALTRDVWTQLSATSELSTKLKYLQDIENFNGPPDKELSFAAEIADLRDKFSSLSDSPENPFLLQSTLDQAIDTAGKINDYATLLDDLRNDAQSDMQISVNRINDLLSQVAEFNEQIAFQINTNRSPAQLQDFRDQVVKELSEEIDISFFTRGDGKIILQTREGQELVGDQATTLSFTPSPLSPKNSYPSNGASGLFLRGDPAITPGGVDLTQKEIGGKLGALLDLRDSVLPQYIAQIDEVAHKLASRFDAQGLRLFTNESGVVPADTAPTLDNPATTATDETSAVEYVGFAGQMRVNANILNDNTLLRKGTYGATINAGSNQVIQRVLDYTFGKYSHQEAIGNVGFDPASISGAGTTLQEYLGVYSTNTFTGAVDLSSYADTNAIVTTANGALDDPNDVFRLTFSDPDLGLSVDVDIDLSAVAAAPSTGNFASDLVTYINNTAIPALAASDQTDLTTMGVTIQVGPSGQLQMLSRGDISVSADSGSVTNGMGATGLGFLGFSEGASSTATDPYFDITVGNGATTRISIDRDDTEADLLSKLQNISDLGVYNFVTDPDGLGHEIRLRPGEDYSDPNFGGALKISGGPFSTDGSGAATGLINDTDGDGVADTAATLPTGINIVSALFGSLKDNNPAAGLSTTELSPVTNVQYQSETYAGSGEYVSFRSSYLGPRTGQNTEVKGSLTLIDFGQKIVQQQTSDVSITKTRHEDEETFFNTIEQQLLNESGVNLDEELSNMIVVQTAYAAAARAVNAIDKLFQELLDSLR